MATETVGMGGAARGATAEERVADTLLQAPAEVELGGRTFRVAPPSVATLVLLSAVVSRLPRFEGDGGLPAGATEAARGERMLLLAIARAEGCEAVGRAVAVLLLGAVGYRRRRRWRRAAEGERLGRWLLERVPPRELFNAFARLVWGMQVADFFAFTAFLQEANMLRGKAERGTTASGR